VRFYLLLLTPLLAAGAAVTHTTHQYDVSIRGSAMAVVARQSPEGLEAESEIRSRSTSARMSLTIADTADGQVLAVRVDTMFMPPPDPAQANVQVRGGESATGAAWHGTVGDGRVTRRLSATGPMSARQFDEVVLFLAPNIPPSIATGVSWADTARFEVDAGQSRVTVRIVSDYRVAGGDARTGFQVVRDFRTERTSRAKMDEGDLLIESQAEGRADYALDGARDVVSIRAVRNTETDMHLPNVDRVLSAATADTVEVNRR
jgi:ribosomal protein S6E (S10)